MPISFSVPSLLLLLVLVVVAVLQLMPIMPFQQPSLGLVCGGGG